MRGAARAGGMTAAATAALVLVQIVLQQPLTLPTGYATVWITGGLAAALVAMGPRPWVVPALAAVILTSTWSAWALGYSWWIVALRALADLTAIALAGLALRRHASSPGTLGRDWTLSALAIIGGSALRAGIMWPTAMSPETPYAAESSTLGSLVIASIIGLSVGFVIGGCVRDPRAVIPTRREQRIFLGLLAATAVFLTATAVLPAQVDRYASPVILDAPIVILAAFSLSYAATTLIASLLVLGQAALLAQVMGVYRDITTPPEIVGYQFSLLVSILFMFMFAAAIEGRHEEQRAVIAASQLSAATFDRSPVPTARVFRQTGIVIAGNDALAALAWRPMDDIIGRPLSAVLTPTRGSFDDALADVGYAEVRVADRVGNESWVRVSRSEVDESGGVDVLVLVDITAERMSEELMRRQSRTDALTGLPNREATLEHLALLLEQARPGCGVGVLIVDIDRLRRVNNTIGRAAGDLVIEAVGRILVRSTHGLGTIGRTGEDEFLVTMPDVVDASEVEAVAAATIAALARPLIIEGTEVVVSVTMGGVVVDGPGSVESALRSASSALGRAKEQYRGTAVVTPRLDPSDLLPPDALMIERDLRAAIASDRLVVLYQPIVDAHTHEIRSAEALVRLLREDGTLLDPAAFLPMANELGLLGDLTWRVLDQAAQAAADWARAGSPISVAVNAPPHWLATTEPARIIDLLASAGLPTASLALEVTEDELVDDGSGVLRGHMHTLRAAGIRIAMDDFGTGYAGLEAFRSLPVDIVKIDQSFIAPLAYRAPDDEELVASVIRLIHRFERLAIAEGVETAEQASVLEELGCDLLQGYRFGRPVDAETIQSQLMRTASPA